MWYFFAFLRAEMPDPNSFISRRRQILSPYGQQARKKQAQPLSAELAGVAFVVLGGLRANVHTVSMQIF